MRLRYLLKDVTTLVVVQVFALLIPAGAILASTQEFLAFVESGAGASATVKTVTVFYVSHHVSPGTNEMFDPAENCVFMINDSFVTRKAFLRAVTPGKRLYCRGNRHRGQFYGLYTTPFFQADGLISRVSGTTAEVTHRQGYIMCTPETVAQTVTAEKGMLVRYEGEDALAQKALKEGRHIRVLAPRKQIVQVLTADAWVRGPQEIQTAYPLPQKNSYTQANEGYYRGYTDATYHFATAGGEGWVDAEQEGPRTGEAPGFLLDGQYTPRGAAVRRGERTLLCPDQIIGHTKAYRIFQVSGEDGLIEGVVKHHKDGRLVIETIECPSGAAADVEEKEITLSLNADAEYHLNGVVGFSSGQTPDPIAAFRYLRFTVLEGLGGLGRGVAEIRYLAGDKEYGPGMKIVAGRDAEKLFDGKTNDIVKWKSGRGATIDCRDEIALTSFKIWTDDGVRKLRSFRLEGAKESSGDGLNWVELLHYDAGEGKAVPQKQWFEVPLDLSNVDANPLTIEKALVPGSFVRVLPALPKGAILVRDNDDASTQLEDPSDVK